MKLHLVVSLFVAITDRNWFELLSQERPDEVNCWQPSGNRKFGAVSMGELSLSAIDEWMTAFFEAICRPEGVMSVIPVTLIRVKVARRA